MDDLITELGLLPRPVRLQLREGAGPAPGTCTGLAGNAEALDAVRAVWTELPRAQGDLPAWTLRVGAAGATGAGAALEAPAQAEGYALRLDADGATVAGADAAGLFYGVQTLRQILRSNPAPPALEILDYPRFPQRGFQIDLGRQMEGMDTLYRYIDHMAARKLNQCHLYLENAFAFSAIPEAVAQAALTADQARSLEAYCRERHMMLVPSVNFLAHNENLLRHPKYAHLSETREGNTFRTYMNVVCDLCPSLPETREILESMIEDLGAAFSAPLLHVGLDESYAMGTCPLCAPIREAEGEGEVHRRHIVWLHDVLAARGKTMLMWADMVFYWPEILERLPKDIVMVDWYYSNILDHPTINYLNYRRDDTTRILREAGFEVMMGTGTGRNAFAMARYGRPLGAGAYLITQWEMSDRLLDESLVGVTYAADCAWAERLTPPEQAAPWVAQNVFGSREAPFVALSGLELPTGGGGTGPARHLRYRVEQVDTAQLNRAELARRLCDAALALPAAQEPSVARLLRRLSLRVNRGLASARTAVSVNEAGLAARAACAEGGAESACDVARYAADLAATAELMAANAAELRALWAEDRPGIEPRGDILNRLEREAEATAAYAREMAAFAESPAPGRAPFGETQLVLVVTQTEANAQRLEVEVSTDGETWEAVRLNRGPWTGPADTGFAMDYSAAGPVPAATRFVRLNCTGVAQIGVRGARLLDLVRERLPEAVVATSGQVASSEHLLANDARVCWLGEPSVEFAFSHPDQLRPSSVTLRIAQ